MSQLDAVKRTAADRLEVPPEQAAKARAVVARYATGSDDARTLLAMLGIERCPPPEFGAESDGDGSGDAGTPEQPRSASSG